MNGCEVYHLDEDGEIVPDAVFAKDEIVLLAEKNGDSWCIEPTLEREPQDAPASNNVQVDLEDALEMSEKTTRNLSKYMAEKYPDVQVSNFSLPDWDFSKEEVRACFFKIDGAGETALYLDGTALHFVVNHAESERPGFLFKETFATAARLGGETTPEALQRRSRQSRRDCCRHWHRKSRQSSIMEDRNVGLHGEFL